MTKIVGKYQHVKNENIDEYFAAVGVPYIPRKMMAMSSPVLEITREEDVWAVKNSSMMRTTIQKFKLGEEYEETMPNGETLKSTSSMPTDNKLVTESIITQTGVKTSRVYDFDGDSCVITLTHGDVSGKRYFTRVN